MPEYYFDKNGNFHYINEEDYTSYIPMQDFYRPTWNQKIVNYYKKLYNVRHIPSSPLESFKYKASPRGFFDLQLTALPLHSEQNIFGKNNTPDYYEKSWPSRIGILDKNGKIISHYFRSFGMSGSMKDATSRIISNIVCGRLFPTKMPYYIGRYDESFGTVGIDLNHIDGVKSLRLDLYLESKGIQLDSVASLLKAYKSGVFKEDLTNSAISQLMFCMFCLPNAIGEQDPNTRNAILLGPNKQGAKFDSVVRIDFENNRINNSPNQMGAATSDGDKIRVYPFGIFKGYEDKKEFDANIVEALFKKLITPEEANLIVSMHKVTKYATRRTFVDNASTEAEQIHRPADKEGCQRIVTEGSFSTDEIHDFAENLIERSKNYIDHVENSFQKAADKANVNIYTNEINLPPLTPEE